MTLPCMWGGGKGVCGRIIKCHKGEGVLHLYNIFLKKTRRELCKNVTQVHGGWWWGLKSIKKVRHIVLMVCPILLPVFSFFSNIEWTRIGFFNRPGMALTPFASCVETRFEPTTIQLLSTRPDFRPVWHIVLMAQKTKFIHSEIIHGKIGFFTNTTVK